MTEQDFIASMRVLFSVWHGTENADQILTDVVATIGSQCFDKHGLELRQLEAECGSQMRAEYVPPLAIDWKNYYSTQAKTVERMFDMLLNPKAK